MLVHGIHNFEIDDVVEAFIDTRHLMVFDGEGRSAVHSPKLAA